MRGRGGRGEGEGGREGREGEGGRGGGEEGRGGGEGGKEGKEGRRERERERGDSRQAQPWTCSSMCRAEQHRTLLPPVSHSGWGHRQIKSPQITFHTFSYTYTTHICTSVYIYTMSQYQLYIIMYIKWLIIILMTIHVYTCPQYI